MNYRFVAKFLGQLTGALGLLMLVSIPWALVEREWGAIPGILYASATSLAAGAVFVFLGRHATYHVAQREALTAVTLGWLVVGVVGALPFIFISSIRPVDAFFESVSGFTTTGASILDNIEALPKSLLFWRSFTHWLGGAGIIVIFIAVFPHLGHQQQVLVHV